MKVSIRKIPLKQGRLRLILDYYPAVINPLNGKQTSYENLKLHLYAKPKNELERQHNHETEQLAEAIRARKQLDLQFQVHGFTPGYKRLQSFKAYFRKLADRQRGMNQHNWDSAVRYFDLFSPKDLCFADIDLSLCEDFKAFLRSGPKLREKRPGISHNSALSYYNKFRNALKQAWREKLLTDDFYALSPGLKEKEAHVEFLTMTDIRRLVQTPTDDELCRRAILLGILTGLRFADIKYLTWAEVRGTKEHYYLQFRQRKTAKIQHMPIANQARELMGKRGEPSARVFDKLDYNIVRDMLVSWPSKAGITKHLTFSCLRHTYATLQLNSGTDIYTVSKMLGHRHVKTTQRYTRLLDEKKRETTKRIVIELDS